MPCRPVPRRTTSLVTSALIAALPLALPASDAALAAVGSGPSRGPVSTASSRATTGAAAGRPAAAAVADSRGSHAVAGAPTRSAGARARAAARPAAATLLTSPALREVAFQILGSAENSSLNWRAQYGYIEYDVEGNAAENRGYTAGIMGFTSKTHDMLVLVEQYARAAPRRNPLARYLPALRRVDGTSSRRGLGTPFVRAWRAAAGDPRFRAAQDRLAERMYFRPAVRQAVADGLGPLGQFAYFDAMVMHGPGGDRLSFGGIRAAARRAAATPATGGDQRRYVNAFLDARVRAMRAEVAHGDVSRVETAQRRFLRAGNLAMRLPLRWSVYGDAYAITSVRAR